MLKMWNYFNITGYHVFNYEIIIIIIILSSSSSI